MKVMLTGAGGQLGRALQRLLPPEQVLACTHQDLDITCEKSVSAFFKEHTPSIIINCAAYNQVDQAEDDYKTAVQVNVEGPHHLAIASAAANIPIVHISSDYVFDGTKGAPYNEFDAPNPLSKYGRSKLDGENEVRSCNPRHFVIRTAWLFYEHGKNFPKTMLGLKDRDEVKVVSDQKGSPTYVPHLAQAILSLIETDAYGLYHMAAQGEASWYDFTCALYKEAGITARVQPIFSAELGRKARRPAYSALASAQTPRILLPDWHQGLKEFLENLESF